MKKCLLSLLCIGLGLGMITHAQTPFTVADDDVLIYLQSVNGKQVYVAQQGTARYTYTLADDECASISPDGRYIAISQKHPATLKIMDFSSQQIVFETHWSNLWERCRMRWDENNHFILLNTVDEQYIWLYFKFENATLTPSTLPIPDYPQLPHFTPTLEPGNIRTFYLQNPVYPTIYLYHQCFIEAMLGYDCPYEGTVIHDLSTNSDIERVSVSATSVVGFYVELDGTQVLRYRVNFDIVGWSPNGRYLAFFDKNIVTEIINGGQIRIYDLQENRYIEDRDNLYPFNFNHRVLWSNTNILLIWKTGRFLGEASDYNDSLAQLVFYNPDTQTGVNSEDIFDVMSGAIFSPDGDSLLIIGKPVIGDTPPVFDNFPLRADLIRISTTTGEHTVIDTNITEIISWRKLDVGEVWGNELTE